MTGPSELEHYLLAQIRAGESDGWAQLVERYQGRLLAFARAQLGQAADAEDAVQETFLRFLRSVERFQGKASLETFLFAILRRTIIDDFRANTARRKIFALPGALDEVLEAQHQFTASWHARKDELAAELEQTLGQTLHELAQQLREEKDFAQLQIVELLFAAQVGNARISELTGVSANHVGVIKHRGLKRLSQSIQRNDAHHSDPALRDALLAEGDLLTRVWEQQRPTCPKRSTLGQFMLGTLQGGWHDYVQFHIETLNCPFCRANLDDIERQTAAATPDPNAASLHQRIMQSTIGFLKHD